MDIRIFEEGDRDAVIELALHCQNNESRLHLGIEDQPDLLHIKEEYIEPGGCFWVAVENEAVIGSIGLMNCGGGTGILKKFFVSEEYRGAPRHPGQKLYKELLSFARFHSFQRIVLDTPKNTARAHQFYEKAGFIKIPEQDLPIRYSYPYRDSDFFLLHLS